MFKTARVLAVTCLTTCLITVPWRDALASERANVAAPGPRSVAVVGDSIGGVAAAAAEDGGAGREEEALVLHRLTTLSMADRQGEIARTALELVPSDARLLMRARQNVASTNEPKLLLGVIAGALIVTGVALLAYGTTSSCKGNNPTDSTCDRNTVIGAVGLSGGTVMLVVWALSK